MSTKTIIAFLCFCALATIVFFFAPRGDEDDCCPAPVLTSDIITTSEPSADPAPDAAVLLVPVNAAEPAAVPQVAPLIAPPLAVAQWIQGPAVQITPGRVMVLEFWEPWCQPCLLTIPHLDELYRKYGDKGLDVVGISGEKPETVGTFVARNREVMTYPVAIGSKKDYQNYFGNTDSIGIPHAYVIDARGNIVWEGNPVNPKMIAYGPDGKILVGGHPISAEFDAAVGAALSETNR